MSLHHYLVVLSPGPLMVVRVPSKGKPGRRAVAPRWRVVLRALTAVMWEHGMLRKDISGLDGLSHPDDWDPAADNVWRSEKQLAEAQRTVERAERAYNGSPTELASFWLYDWREEDGGSFTLVRKPAA